MPGAPGKKWIGKVERDGSEVRVAHPKDGRPWMIVSWDGNRHFLSFIASPGISGGSMDQADRRYLPQVINPFRTRLPLYLPED